jgi:hypothetical protein
MQPERVDKPVTKNAAPKVSKKQVQQTPEDSTAAPRVTPDKIRKQKDELQTTKKEQKLQTTDQPQLQTSNPQLKKTKLSKESVAKIQARHRNFQAKPNTEIASAQFNPNYRIEAELERPPIRSVQIVSTPVARPDLVPLAL